MNEKFYNLPYAKQQAILNAGYRVFSQNSYKKSPVSEIADAAGISKSLLFHYFRNKKEFYLYLWEECGRISIKTMTDYGCYNEHNFFSMIEQGMRAKIEIMKQYPYMGEFVIRAFYENDPEVQQDVRQLYEKFKSIKAIPSLENLDSSQFIEGVDTDKVWREVCLASEGYLWEFQKNASLNSIEGIKKLETDFTEMITFWKQVYLKKEEGN